MNLPIEKHKINYKNEWLTPIEIINALGEFDLDPCSPINRKWDTAKKHINQIEDGLKTEWEGRVWCFPPFAKESVKWLEKCAVHGNCIALTFVRSDTKLFHQVVFPTAYALFFLEKRIKFYSLNGEQGDSSSSPSVLIAFDKNNADVLKNCKLNGYYVDLKF